jgi:diacylglycerol kinase (ATP)
MAKPDVRGVQRIIEAFGYSLKGFKAAWENEEAFRTEIIVLPFMCVAAFYVGKDLTQIAFLLACLFLVLAAELVNSAIEAVVDRISDDIHPLSGRAKDMGSSIVLIALIINGIVWGLLIYQNFF